MRTILIYFCVIFLISVKTALNSLLISEDVSCSLPGRGGDEKHVIEILIG